MPNLVPTTGGTVCGSGAGELQLRCSSREEAQLRSCWHRRFSITLTEKFTSVSGRDSHIHSGFKTSIHKGTVHRKKINKILDPLYFYLQLIVP